MESEKIQWKDLVDTNLANEGPSPVMPTDIMHRILYTAQGHITSALSFPIKHNLKSTHKKMSNKPTLRIIVQNNQSVFFMVSRS